MHLLPALARRLPASFKKKILAAARLLPGRTRLLRWCENASTDVFLVSPPKCGRTWLKVMIARALQLHFGLSDVNYASPEGFSSLDARIPRLKWVNDGGMFTDRPSDLSRSKERFRSARVVLLTRDPRDVMISSYFHRQHRDLTGKFDDARFKDSLSSYIREERGSLQTIVEFYKIWAENMEVPTAVHMVRYEDMRRTPADALRGVLEFCGLGEISDETIDDAVRFGSFENMRALEENQTIDDHEMQPGEKGNTDTYKVRRGKVGGFHDYLEGEDLAYVNETMRQMPAIFRYTL